MEKQWNEMDVNEIKLSIGDRVKNLYTTFNKYKFYFNKNYDSNNMQWNNFDKFYNEIQILNKTIERFINVNFEDIEWDVTDTDKWILTCFYKYNGSKVKNDGYVIELVKQNKFETKFCAMLKEILTTMIAQKIRKNNQYHNYHYFYMEDENKMNELQDLKQYIEEINLRNNFELFIRDYLTKKELLIFTTVLNSLYNDKQIDSNYIKNKLGLNNSTYKKHAMNIRNKYKQYKIDMKID